MYSTMPRNIVIKNCMYLLILQQFISKKILQEEASFLFHFRKRHMLTI